MSAVVGTRGEADADEDGATVGDVGTTGVGAGLATAPWPGDVTGDVTSVAVGLPSPHPARTKRTASATTGARAIRFIA
jgi:hypothetical protein